MLITFFFIFAPFVYFKLLFKYNVHRIRKITKKHIIIKFLRFMLYILFVPSVIKSLHNLIIEVVPQTCKNFPPYPSPHRIQSLLSTLLTHNQILHGTFFPDQFLATTQSIIPDSHIEFIIFCINLNGYFPLFFSPHAVNAILNCIFHPEATKIRNWNHLI